MTETGTLPLACDLDGRRVVIVGGGSGFGLATARAVVARGGSVTLMGRTADKLAAAARALDAPDRVAVHPLDMTDGAAVAGYFAGIEEGAVDHLVVTASTAAHGPFLELPEEAARAMFDSKFWGPYALARAALPRIADGGSITFFSGVLSRRPGMNCSALGAVNAAVEGLTRGLALELGPRIRVNCCAPGMARTEAYARMPEDRREAMYRATGASLPVQRVGQAHEVADAVLFLMTNTFTTGVVLDVDGGHMIRQYAQR